MKAIITKIEKEANDRPVIITLKSSKLQFSFFYEEEGILKFYIGQEWDIELKTLDGRVVK